LGKSAGQERYRAITKNYYKNSHAAIILFDLTNEESFISVEDWLNDLRMNASEDLRVLIVGNKLDLAKDPSRRQVSTKRARKQAHRLGFEYSEISAISKENLFETFNQFFHGTFGFGLIFKGSRATGASEANRRPGVGGRRKKH
jgi:GTPase SAR1 family protein